MDPTEEIRKVATERINAQMAEREDLEVTYGQVWDTKQLQEDFTVHSFLAPFVYVTRKTDGVRGTLAFQHMPRYYFSFEPEQEKRMKKRQWAALLTGSATAVEWAFKEQQYYYDVEIFDSYDEAKKRAVEYLKTTIRNCKKRLKLLEAQTEEEVNERMEDLGAEEWLAE